MNMHEVSPDARLRKLLSNSWPTHGDFGKHYDRAKPHTLVSADRCYMLHVLASMALSLGGDIWECGVYRGGTAILFAELIASTQGTRSRLHLFDTFQGMPITDPEKDLHQHGDFADTDLATVQERVGRDDIVRSSS